MEYGKVYDAYAGKPISVESWSHGDFESQSVAADNDVFDLPAELEAIIASAKSVQESSIQIEEPSSAAEVRYYPTYTEGELCSSRSSSAFESWETSYASLEDCCEVAFSWDYDACLGL
ncbi:hypothetical protein ACHAXR_004605 [Thalassiosira sp. AJA248-18]